MIYMLEYAIT